MSTKLKPEAVSISRGLTLFQVRDTKRRLMGMLEGGDRDWGLMRALFDKYADAQDAADVLSGQSHVEEAK